MKKFLSIILILTFMLSSVLPVFGLSLNVFDITTERDSYKQGETVNYSIFLSKDGTPLVYRDATIVIEDGQGTVVNVSQASTNVDGLIQESYVINEDGHTGTYTIKVTSGEFISTKSQTFQVTESLRLSTISTAKSNYYTDEAVEINGLVRESGIPKAFIDANIVVYTENRDIVLVEQARSDKDGRFSILYRYSSSEDLGKRFVEMTVADATISHEFKIIKRPVTPPVNPPVNPPVTPPVNPPIEDSTPEEPVGEIVRFKPETTQSEKTESNGEVIVEVVIGTQEASKALSDKASNAVSIIVNENTSKKVEVNLPNNLVVQNSGVTKAIEIESNNMVMLIQPNAFIIDADDEIILSIEENEASEIISYSNISSRIYDFNFISKKTGQKVAFEKTVEVKIPFEKKEETRINRLGLYWFNEETEQWDYVGGKIGNENNILTAKLNHFSRYTVMEYVKEFDDFDENHWAYKEADLMIGRHIIKGMGESTFEPESGLTIAQFIALIVRATELEQGSTEVNIRNIEESQWYYNPVTIAASHEIIDPSALLLANELITREQMAVIVSNTLKVLGYEPEKQYSVSLEVYDDVNLITPDSQEAVAFVTEIGIFKGKGSAFEPLGNAKRSEATAVMYRVMKFLDLL